MADGSSSLAGAAATSMLTMEVSSWRREGLSDAERAWFTFDRRGDVPGCSGMLLEPDMQAAQNHGSLFHFPPLDALLLVHFL